jgi:hypothetical protein
MTTTARQRILTVIVAVTCAFISGIGTPQVIAAPPTAQEKQVDQSIVQALRYISTEQQPNGAWRISSSGDSTAATSLAVMSFMASGHVPGEGPYGRQLSRGIDWVISKQKPNGMLVFERGHGPMYSHGISTLMLAEVAGMVGKERGKPVRRALEKAIRLILDSQDVRKNGRDTGGWRYNPTSTDSDLSVTGWQLLALRAAKNIGCDVPADSIDRAVAYVKRLSVAGNRGFGYQTAAGATPTRTGTGIVCLEICGKHHSPEALGAADLLLQKPLRFNTSYFYYGVYYCSVGMFKVGGRYWQSTKDHLVPILLDNQSADGSWSGRSNDARHGPVYCTCMSVLALAVEYRYLPIYQR